MKTRLTVCTVLACAAALLPATIARGQPYTLRYITQPALTCRLRWEAGTFALWDNRLCLHQAFNDTDGFRRELYRTTVAGEVPA